MAAAIPTPAQLAKKIPGLYSDEKTPFAEKKIKAHFFGGRSDWFVTEYDPEEDLAFGFCNPMGDMQMAEWGYVSIAELRDVRIAGWLRIEYDRHWTVKPAKEFPGKITV